MENLIMLRIFMWKTDGDIFVSNTMKKYHLLCPTNKEEGLSKSFIVGR